MSESFLKIESVSKSFGNTKALDNVSLDINKSELFSLLGSSGCGKSTLLRIIAGFEKPDSGKIYLDGEDITSLPPYLRPLNIMFQNYALFPHLNVKKNIEFGLKEENLENNEIDHRVKEITALLELTGLENRKITEISGGQQQRVALARCLVKKPKLLLLDEPLAALDKKLRVQTQFELVNLQYKLGITFIIVTHDQEEALSVCDVVSVLENGSVIQSATPQEIYLNPVSQTVANSVGDPNILKGFSINGMVDTSLGTFVSAYDGALDVSIRPECIELNLDTEGNYVVKECTFYGHDQVISFQNSKGEVFRARSLPNTIYEAGDKINIEISEVTTFPSKT